VTAEGAIAFEYAVFNAANVEMPERLRAATAASAIPELSEVLIAAIKAASD
jgi:hypothetical protein